MPAKCRMKINIRVLAIQIAGMFVVFAAALFLAAGTLAWFAGWVFLALFFGFVIAISLWLLKNDPALLRERMAGFRIAEKGWDRVILAIMHVLFFAWLVVMPFDAMRFQWSQIPAWLRIIGVLLLLGSFVLLFLTFRENSYLSPVVRVQGERGQHVISTGPYRHVRHPMYAAALLLFVGTTMLLGSWYGLFLSVLLEVIIARRAVLEERTLREELPGYDAYLTKVKYRLLPYIW